MNDSTYIVLALALCCLIGIFFDLTRRQTLSKKPEPISILDMREYYDLPPEVKSLIRRMLPDPTVVKQTWSSLGTDQKRAMLMQMIQSIPRPGAPPVEPQPIPSPSEGLKKGFLLQKDEHKKPKNEKHDKIVTLGTVDTTTATIRDTSLLDHDGRSDE